MDIAKAIAFTVMGVAYIIIGAGGFDLVAKACLPKTEKVKRILVSAVLVIVGVVTVVYAFL